MLMWFLILLLSGACIETRIPLTLGTATVWLVTHEAPKPGVTFLNVHDDENTAVLAARAVLDETGGRLLALEHTGERMIRFEIDGRRFVLDPNRIFTDDGAVRTLERGGGSTPAALAAVRHFATHLLKQTGLRAGVPLVTLHNNTEGAYSARSYEPGGTEAGEALRVALRPNRDADDFYFVTEPLLFEALRARGWNVVLQDHANMTDDGSLSVWCARMGVPYINVEAQHGHRAVQEAMLRDAVRALHDLYPALTPPRNVP